jgi:hypothetical protein
MVPPDIYERECLIVRMVETVRVEHNNRRGFEL